MEYGMWTKEKPYLKKCLNVTFTDVLLSKLGKYDIQTQPSVIFCFKVFPFLMSTIQKTTVKLWMVIASRILLAQLLAEFY